MLLGRDVECARIDGLLENAPSGTSSALVVRGETGIGKTALCEYAAELAAGMTVVRARCAESESELPFSALSDLLRPILGSLTAIPPPQRAALEGALAIGPPVGGDRFTVCAATLSTLAAAAEEAPVLAVVDDAQWLDASSAEALLFAARRLDAEGVVLIFAGRPEPGDALGRAGLPELRLEGLDRDAARRLLLERAEHPIADGVVERLITATAGNPLALIEIPIILTEAQLGGDEPLPEPLPVGPTLEQALRQRVEELPDELQRVLLVAAASDSGDVEAITRALEAMGLRTATLDRAEVEGLVTLEGGRLEFRHPLLRSAIYHGATPAARRAIHRVLGEASTGENSAERRAWHLAAATPVPDDEVARALEDAALDARRRGGHAEAASAFERAARLTPRDEERARRLLEAAEDARHAGDSDRVLALLTEAAGSTGDAILRARIEHMRGAVEMWRGAPMAAHDRLVAEATRIEGLDPPRAARMLTDAGWACFMAGEIEAGTDVARRALAAAEGVGGLAEILATTLYGIGLLLSGRAQEAIPFVRRHEALLEDRDFLERHYQLIRPAAQVLIWLEDYGRARQLFTRVIEAARANSAPSMLPYALAGLSELDFRTGAWPAAYANASEAARLAAETQQDAARSFALVTLARVEAAQGREADCRAHVQQAVGLASSGVGSILGYGGSALGLLELGLGRNAEAIAELEVLARRVRERGLGEPAVIQWAPDLIEAYVRSGRPEAAEDALEDFERQARETGRTWALAAAARCRGLLADDEDFERSFAEALGLHEVTPTPFEQARTELCLGERLRRARRRTDAREPLRAALETFGRLGAVVWAERARVEIQASGETIRKSDTVSLQELTPQELQVALVVAGGATNREAGAALFLSPKTIEAHLGRIYRKLSVRSRTELASRLASEGALAEAVA